MFVADRVAHVSKTTGERRGGRSGWVKVGAGVGALAAGVALSVVRTKEFGATDTIWAEDARIFYQGTTQHGFFDLLFTPYNGYLHFVPRVLIEIVRIFPLAWAAEVIAVMGALVMSACALLVYRAGSKHLQSPALRVAVAAPVVLPYIGQLELANNFACLHFLLLYTAFWMVIWHPAKLRLQILAAFVLFCTVGSDPVAGVFLPLAVMRWWALRDAGPGRWRDGWLRGWQGGLPTLAMGLGMVFQAVGILFRHALNSRRISPHYDPIWALREYVQTVVGQGLFTEHANTRVGAPVADNDARYVAWALAGVVLVVALARLTAPNWPLVVAALVHSVLLFCGLAMQGGSAAPRYVLPAICLFLVAVAGLLVPRKDTMALVTPYAVPAYGVLGLVALCIFGGYAEDMQWRGHGPSFDSQVGKAAVACGAPGAQEAEIRVAPAFAPWSMTVPCDLVRGRHAFFR